MCGCIKEGTKSDAVEGREAGENLEVEERESAIEVRDSEMNNLTTSTQNPMTRPRAVKETKKI